MGGDGEAGTRVAVSLDRIFEGWEGYNTALVRAIAPRTPEELAWRPDPTMRSVGEVTSHIAMGRIDWFHRMGASASMIPARSVEELTSQPSAAAELAIDAKELVHWLDISWRMIRETLQGWTVDDLWTTYRQPYAGKVYSVSHQWVLFRILIHDVHHGGQLSVMLRQKGIDLPDLGYLGGHLTEPPLADE